MTLQIWSIFFLSETRNTVAWIEWICVKLGFHGCLTVDKVGKCSGLALLWTDDIDLLLLIRQGILMLWLKVRKVFFGDLQVFLMICYL